MMKDYNFFEPYLRRQREVHKKRRRVYGISLAIIMIFIVTPFINHLVIERYEKQVTEVSHTLLSSEEYQQRMRIEERMEENKKQQAYLDSLIQFDNEVKKSSAINDHLMHTITNAMPEDLFLQSMRIGTEEVAIEGVAKNQIAIAILEGNLRQISDFQDIFISNINIQDEEHHAFTIRFEIKDGTFNEIK